MKQNKSLLIGLTVSVISFILIYSGIRFINNSQIMFQNILVYALFSLILGGLSAAFYYYKLKYLLSFFIVGIGLGYFEMFRSFINSIDGWGDLAGIASLFVWIVVGFLTGSVIQISSYLYKKYNNRNKQQK